MLFIYLFIYSPHLCVGFLFSDSVSHRLLLLRLLHRHLCIFQYNFVKHHLSHTTLSHIIFHTHNFVTHHLSHTPLSHIIFHTHLPHQLCHTPSSTQLCNFVIFHTQLSHTPSVTHNFVSHHLSHITLSHTIFHTQLRFAWRAWYLGHWAGSGGALGPD